MLQNIAGEFPQVVADTKKIPVETPGNMLPKGEDALAACFSRGETCFDAAAICFYAAVTCYGANVMCFNPIATCFNAIVTCCSP